MPGRDKPVLLFAFANDRQVAGRYLHALADERRRVLAAVAGARQAGRCEPHDLPDATVDDLSGAVLGAEYGDRIAIFHFAGHAGDAALLFAARAGAASKVPAGNLATVFGNRPSLKLVFLNGCATRDQVAAFLAAGVPAVIATDEAIDDATAGDLAALFYQGIAAGRSIAIAFEDATALLALRFEEAPRQAYHRSFRPEMEGTPAWPWQLHGDGDVIPIPVAEDLSAKATAPVSAVSDPAGADRATECDFFLSCAREDRGPGERLAALLERQGRRVYQAVGAQAAAEQAALASARVAVFLLSARGEHDPAQREAALRALDLKLRGQLEQVVPVYVAGSPPAAASWDLGLRRFDPIDLDRHGLEATAAKLGALIAAPVPVMAAHQALRTYGALFHHAALKIDRTDQWLPIVNLCKGPSNAIFLLRGPRQQNLDLFVFRVWYYLAQECQRHYHPVVVPRTLEDATPRSVAAWENHLRYGLAAEGQAGTAETLLGEAARHHPVFLVFGQATLCSGSLDHEERVALLGFLRGRLPELITRASEGAHPVRALIATHYEDEEDPLVRELDEAAFLGTEGSALRYIRLKPLQPLDWSDIEAFLDSRQPRRPPLHVYRRLKAAWDRLDRGDLQFRDVVDLLARELE